MRELKVKNDNVAPVVEKLFEEILAPNTDDGIGTDNMTAIWIKIFNDNLKEWAQFKGIMNSSWWSEMI